MPRTFSTAIQGEIDRQYAGEPMIIVEVNWVDDAWVAYSDRKLNGEDYPYPLLVSINQFDSTQVVTGGSDNQQTTLTLNDIDGTIRDLIDSQDLHLRPVKIYLTFQGLPFAEKALIFEGLVNSPITWDEGGRTLSFDVMSEIESVEAGFTMEDGEFPFIEPEDRNKPWPLVFGQVCNMEAVQLRATRKGFLGEGVGVQDPTIEERLCQAYKLRCPTITATAASDGTAGDSQDGDGGSVANVRQGIVDPQCVQRRFNKICEILTEREQQQQYVKDVFQVTGGDEFPQNQTIIILIGEVRFEGVMVGETFTVSQVFHPDPKDNPPCVNVNDASWGYKREPDIGDNPSTVEGCEQGGSSQKRDVRDGSGASWEYFNQFERSNFIWLPPGSEVLLASESEVLNIVSLLPGTVDQVAAYRNFSDTKLLTAVPTDLYTVVNTDFGGYQVVEVRLDAPLSTIDTEGLATWDDEIFVSFTSSIGPNPVDTIQWLVETYTDLEIDTASFTAARLSLTRYPSNFFVKARPRVLDLIADVAYQARCGVFVRNNKVFLVYLPKEPDSVKTLTEDDILPNTFRITHTTTEDLETRTTVSWSEGEAGVFDTDPTSFELVLKHNVPKYGIFDAEYNYYTMNIFELVEKSATFWSIRKSNTWKLVDFETPMVHLNLDVFDCVTINLEQFGPFKVIIDQARYNIDTNTISFKAWTPVRSGEDDEYFWAWPADKPEFAVHPLIADAAVESGDDYPLTVIPPEGHPLRGAYSEDTAVPNTDGDRYPSDVGDTFPQVVCKIATGAEISDDIEPVFDPFEPLAEDNFQDKLDNIESGNVSGGSASDSTIREACGAPIPDLGCVYEVKVLYVTPQAVATRDSDGGTSRPRVAGPCGCGTDGRPCFGPQHVFCHTFGSLSSATSFAQAKRQEAAQLWNEGRYNCGITSVLQVLTPTGIEGGGPAGECEDGGGGGGGAGGGGGDGGGDGDGQDSATSDCEARYDAQIERLNERKKRWEQFNPLPGDEDEKTDAIATIDAQIEDFERKKELCQFQQVTQPKLDSGDPSNAPDVETL